MATICEVTHEHIIEVKDFSFYYAGVDKPNLKSINMPIGKGAVTALIGPSGCGKTTLLRCFNRMHDLYPGNRYEGDIHFKGRNILDKKDDLIKLRTQIGMIFQKPTPFPMSIFDNVAYGLRISGINNVENRVEEALKDASLWDNVKDRLDSPALTLSGGEQQRLCIARAIALKPKVLLFDEPTTGIDIGGEKTIYSLLYKFWKERDLTILLITHDLNIVFTYSTNCLCINRNKKCYGAPKEILTPKQLQKIYGTDIKFYEHTH